MRDFRPLSLRYILETHHLLCILTRTKQEEAQEISQCGSSFGGLSSPDTPQAMEVWEQDGVEWMS